jgi:YVTN family beta-propeller protein
VAVIDTATNTVLRTIRVGDFPQDVAISHDGSLAYVTAMTGTAVSVIDTATDTIIATLPVSGSTGVAISPDGNTIYVASAGKVTIVKFGQAQTPAISV